MLPGVVDWEDLRDADRSMAAFRGFARVVVS